MTTLFEQQDGQYEMQGDHELLCVILPTKKKRILVYGECDTDDT